MICGLLIVLSADEVTVRMMVGIGDELADGVIVRMICEDGLLLVEVVWMVRIAGALVVTVVVLLFAVEAVVAALAGAAFGMVI